RVRPFRARAGLFRAPRRVRSIDMRPVPLCLLLAAALSGPAAATEKRAIQLSDVFPERPSSAPTAFAWSPDAKRLAYLQPDPGGKTPLLRVRRMSDGSVLKLTREEEGPLHVTISTFSWAPAGDAIVAVADGDLMLFTLPVKGEPSPPRRLTQT